MAHTLEQFAAACHRILKTDPGPTGRQQVCTLLREVLQDEAFVTAHLGDDVPERKLLYEDPELGFCILAHVYTDARTSPPHDHGSSWAVYGQAIKHTDMSEYKRLDGGDPLRDRIVAKAGRLREDEDREPGLRALRLGGAAQRHPQDGEDEQQR